MSAVPAASASPAAAAVLSSPPAPAVTDATAATEAELHEAVVHFLPVEDPSTLLYERASGGVNNKCTYVKNKEGEEYVLRIYNNGLNTPRVAYEHAVLRLLASKQFSFEVPVPMSVRSDPTGTATSVLLASGASACCFRRIRGGAADSSSLDTARAIGAATAELVNGMKGLSIDLPLPNPLYRNM
jgi:Ser/Thr protein kinase RdoA (MazF antagonist)